MKFSEPLLTDHLMPVSHPYTAVQTQIIDDYFEVAPSTACIGTKGASGAVTAGAHSYWVTFVTMGGGETTISPVSNVVTTETSNLTVALTAIPTGNKYVISRKIYRTAAGADPAVAGNRLYLATIADNTTTTYSDIIADGSLGAAAPTSSTTNLSPKATKALSVATTGAYTIVQEGGVVCSVTLNSGVIHFISVKSNCTVTAGTVTYWY